MSGTECAEGVGTLRVEVIDEQGRVVEAVYVGEISGQGRGDETPVPALGRADRRHPS